jgi:hypothetical protein
MEMGNYCQGYEYQSRSAVAMVTIQAVVGGREKDFKARD